MVGNTGCGGHVEARAPVEEPAGLEAEPRRLHGHHRPVLEARRVGDSKDVPHYKVGAGYRAVPSHPLGEAVRCVRLVRVVAAGELEGKGEVGSLGVHGQTR